MSLEQQIWWIGMLVLLAAVFRTSLRTIRDGLGAVIRRPVPKTGDGSAACTTMALVVIPKRQPLRAQIREALLTLRGGVKQLVRDSGASLASRLRTLCPAVFQDMLRDLAWLVLITAALAMCAVFSGSTDTYSAVLLPSLLVCAALIFRSETVGGARLMTLIFCLMITIGFSLQASLAAQQDNGIAALGSYTMTTVFALGLAVCFGVPVVRLMTEYLPAKTALWLLQILSLVLYLVLVTAARAINGASNWIRIFGFSLQLTEFAKLFALISFGIVFGSDALTPKQQRRAGFGVLLLHAVFLALCNEFATLVILVCVFTLMGTALAAERRKLIAGLILLALLAAVLVLPCKAAYDWLHPEDAAAVQQTASPIVGKLAGVYEKGMMRVLAVSAPEKAGDFGYQQTMARRAMLLAGWFGSTRYHVSVPVAESDFVFAVLMLKLGIVSAVATLLMWAALPFAAVPALRSPSVRGTTALALLLALLLTTVCSVGSVTGCLPAMGVAPAFLGRGGTAAMINLTIAIFLIDCSAVRKERKTP